MRRGKLITALDTIEMCYWCVAVSVPSLPRGAVAKSVVCNCGGFL